MFAYLPFIGLALVLGFKHSFDTDHLLAVGNLLRKADTVKTVARYSINWAIGHMLTAAIVTTLLYIFRESVLRTLLSHFDRIVGVMLVCIGIWSIWDMFVAHNHAHEHGKKQHSHIHLHDAKSAEHLHRHMFGIGIIHGLASNDELLVLLTASLGVATLGGILVGVGVFSIGVVLGMALFALLFSYPLLKTRSEAVYKTLSTVAGAASIIYGVLMLFAVI